jgi:hypothetical protein
MGVLGMGLGMLPVLTAFHILPSRPPRPGDSPVWVAVAIGLVFFLAGVSAMMQGFTGPMDSSGNLPSGTSRPLRAFYDLIGMTIAVSLSGLITWVAFGSGTRAFSVSSGAPGSEGIPLGTSMAGQMTGRIAFGVGAGFMWLITVVMLAYTLRRWFPRR